MNWKELARDVKDNRYFRMLMFPVGKYRFIRDYKSYLKSEYPKKIQALKGKFAGDRCFIIGNGPSLSADDLNLIKGEYSFGTNKIYNIYGKTVWRPTFYICMDSMSIIEEIAKESSKINAEYYFINWQQHKVLDKRDNLYFCNTNPRYVVNIWGDDKVTFSEDCSVMIDNARTVTYTAIQLAVYMGFREIYLLGVDANYPFYRDAKGRRHCTGMEKAHFENGGYNRIDYQVRITNENGYKRAKEYCDKKGIKISNCTRGGQLEIFERRTLEDVLNGDTT